jgi:hypothetical protein
MTVRRRHRTAPGATAEQAAAAVSTEAKKLQKKLMHAGYRSLKRRSSIADSLVLDGGFPLIVAAFALIWPSARTALIYIIIAFVVGFFCRVFPERIIKKRQRDLRWGSLTRST